ncbi:MAG: phosphoglucosamine mutase [bacterium]
MSLMVSISGIRGIVGESLTPEVIIKYAAAYSEYCNRGLVVVGRDGRITGASISNLVISTLLSMGCDVLDIGVCPTPTVQLGVEKKRAAGGISITASHNPIEWNGLKFMSYTGLFLDPGENKDFWDIANSRRWKYTPWNAQGSYIHDDCFIDQHILNVLALPYIDQEAIQKRKLKVVVDCVNAAGGRIIPQLLREFGCELVEMNTNLSGIFSHTPEPIPENLTSLCEQVKIAGADLGIAVDPDVDRLVLIDEHGEPIGEEYTIASIIKFVLGKEAQKIRNAEVVVNLSTTRAVDDIAALYGARVHRTPVGEINVAKKMKEIGALVGGEGSGGVILPASHIGRDAPVGIGLALQHLVEFGGTMSELKKSLPQYFISKGKVNIASLNPDEVLKIIQDQYSSSAAINTEDGLKIDFPDYWIHLRKSNTEPIIRLIAEAPQKDQADQLVKQLKEKVFSL